MASRLNRQIPLVLSIRIVVILAAATFIFADGLFVFLPSNPPLVQRSGSGLSFVYPGDIHNQTFQEGVFSLLLWLFVVLVTLLLVVTALKMSKLASRSVN